jgi:hypothetical protein
MLVTISPNKPLVQSLSKEPVLYYHHRWHKEDVDEKKECVSSTSRNRSWKSIFSTSYSIYLFVENSLMFCFYRLFCLTVCCVNIISRWWWWCDSDDLLYCRRPFQSWEIDALLRGASLSHPLFKWPLSFGLCHHQCKM